MKLHLNMYQAAHFEQTSPFSTCTFSIPASSLLLQLMLLFCVIHSPQLGQAFYPPSDPHTTVNTITLTQIHFIKSPRIKFIKKSLSKSKLRRKFLVFYYTTIFDSHILTLNYNIFMSSSHSK